MGRTRRVPGDTTAIVMASPSGSESEPEVVTIGDSQPEIVTIADTQRPEVVTLDGQSCATYDPSCSTNGGNPCPSNSVWNVGLDGTLFTVGLAGVPTHCDAEAWPQLFK